MCGIAGYFGTRELEEAHIKACLHKMKQRGPDMQDYRVYSEQGHQCYLLFSRLSILDLDERSNQPFELGNEVLNFNGELYNYLELKAALQQQGTEFHTRSDTEVLLQQLRHFGVEGLDACEGMWAFAYYRQDSQELSLSRDRFGEKPLYLYRDETGLYFASEVKFIFALLGRTLPIHFPHLYRYLVNGYKSLYKQSSSFFEGISELQPGHCLHLSPRSGPRLERYWRPRYESIEAEMSYAEAVEGTRQRLIEAVKIRLRSDVPLAFCMSGGIDSNSLIGIAHHLGHPVHGFTIMNSDSRYEEQDMVQHMVETLGLRHTPLPVETSDFLGRLRSLIQYHDAPVYTITYYAHWLLQAQIAEHGYRISISGTAADELFSGYFDHHLAYLYAIRNSPEHGKAVKAWEEHILPIVRNPFLQQADLFVHSPLERDHIYLNARDFAGFLSYDWYEAFQEQFYHHDLLRNRMLNELFHEATPVILHEDDLNAMYYSIENRSPFLDRQLFEWSLKIPTAHLMQEARTKSVLRDAMRGIVPDKILDNRRKVGFNAPIFDYLDVNDSTVRAEIMADSPIYEHVKAERIQELLDKASLPNSQSKFLFYFVSAKLFLEQFS